MDGWRIAQDGDAEFNGALFAENIQNVNVLFQDNAGHFVDGSKVPKQIVLNYRLSDYDVLEIAVRVPADNIHGITSIPVSAIPSSGTSGACSFSGGQSNQILTLILTRGSVGKSMKVDAIDHHRGYIHSIVGIKNPVAATTSPSGPTDPTVTPIPTLVVENSSLTVEEGSTTTIKVKLSSQPTGNVTVTATESDPDVSVSPSTRTFSTTNWDRYQNFTVTGIVDADSVADSANVLLTGSGSGVIDTATVSISITEPATTRPGKPSTPSADTREQNSLTLSTTPGSGGAATLYRWRYSTNSNVTDFDTIVTSTGPSITISGLTSNTNYWIDVRAENSAGNSDYSTDLATSTLAAAAGATTVTANAGSNVSVGSGNTVRIGGTDTITNPSGSTTYSWTRRSGTGGSLSSSTVRRPTFTAPTVTSNRTIVYRKTTTNNGVSDTDDVTITVQASVAFSLDISGTDTNGDHDKSDNIITFSRFMTIPAGALDSGVDTTLSVLTINGPNHDTVDHRNSIILSIIGLRNTFIPSIESTFRLTITSGSNSVETIGLGDSEPYLIKNNQAGIESFFNSYVVGTPITVRMRSS